MSKNAKILSALLVLFMLIGTLASLSLLPVSAAAATTEEPKKEGTEEEVIEDDDKPKFLTVQETIEAYLTDIYESAEEKLEKDERMTLRLSRGAYELYINDLTGEFGLKNVKTGQILLSNPYDLAEVKNDSVKAELLSQVVVTFKDLANNGTTRRMYSYTDSAARGQITVKNIKNGIRVEYTIGKESARRLVPVWIEASRFQQQILLKIDDISIRTRMKSFYSLNDPNDKTKTETVIEEIHTKYPCTQGSYYKADYSASIEFKTNDGIPEEYSFLNGDEMAIYVLDPTTVKGEREMNMLEGWVKLYCPLYNYEELQYDIDLTGYKEESSAAALFKLALEYYLSEDGLEYRWPSNGLQFDETAYEVTDVSILQYLGATSSDCSGYTFIPDGSGTIIRNEDIKADNKGYNIMGMLYGDDFSYHKLTGNGKSELMTFPVYGVVGNEIHYNHDVIVGYEDVLDEFENPVYMMAEEDELTPIVDHVGDQTKDAQGHLMFVLSENLGQRVIGVMNQARTDENEKLAKAQHPDDPDVTWETAYDYYYIDYRGNKMVEQKPIYEEYTIPQGFAAILTEGAALTSITSSHGGDVLHKYNSVYCSFNPRPSDSYVLSDAISVGSSNEFTVVSERKYTGSYRVKIVMLWQGGGTFDYESTISGKTETATYFEATYAGMALAYSQYLQSTGELEKITNPAADIPLYIETLGMLETEDTVMTMPVLVDTPLTTFEDMKAMYGKLKDAGITNVNFRLNGFTEGGAEAPLYPTTVKFEKVLGGNKGFTDFEKFCEENGIMVYTDFDFANISGTGAFDKFAYSKWTVKTIDDRYSGKREYDATFQAFSYIGSTCVSPSFYDEIFERFEKAFDKLWDKRSGVSVGSLGSDLNSDFDEDDPYNRADSEEQTVAMLKALSEKYGKVMVNGGNAYSWKYADVILNAALDGSNYLRSSQSVPFIGMVLHGYVVLAGEPTNEAGNLYDEILKIVENGATPYFLLSAQNTSKLKESLFLSGYYSVNFDTWFDDLLSVYGVLNNALKDVQDKRIIDHKFVGLDTGDNFSIERVLLADEKAKQEALYNEDYEQYQKDKTLAETRYANLVYHTEEAAKAAGLPILYIPLDTLDEETIEEEFLDVTNYVDYEYIDLYDAAGNQIYFAAVYTGYEYEEFEFKRGMKTDLADGSIIYMAYEDGTAFLLNYNSFDVKITIGDKTYYVAAAGSHETLEAGKSASYADTAYSVKTDEDGTKTVTYYGFVKIQ